MNELTLWSLVVGCGFVVGCGGSEIVAPAPGAGGASGDSGTDSSTAPVGGAAGLGGGGQGGAGGAAAGGAGAGGSGGVTTEAGLDVAVDATEAGADATEAGADATEAGVDATEAGADAAPDQAADAIAARCTKNKPFGTPVPVAGINSATQSTECAWMSADERRIWYGAVRATGGLGGVDIFSATRASTSDAFSNPVLVPNVSTAGAQDRTPVVTADGLRMFYTHQVGNEGTIYLATRSSLVIDFANVGSVANLHYPGALEFVKSVSADGKTLYFGSDRTGDFALYQSTADAQGQFAAPVLISGSTLDKPGVRDNMPVISADGLSLYFESNRTGASVTYVAHRATATDPFGLPSALENVQLSGGSEPSWVSADECVLLLTTNANGHYEVYQATRPQ